MLYSTQKTHVWPSLSHASCVTMTLETILIPNKDICFNSERL